MPVPKGYAGKVLIVELEKQKADIVPTDKFWEEYGIDPRVWLGGDGFITKVLWEDFSTPVDPFSSENEIIIATGPWTATAAPWAGRAMLGCISPETGGFSSGSFGWMFPSILKYAGFDIVIVRGRSKKPIYVFIDDQEVVFRDASHIWGKETGETVKMIRDELEERYEGEIRVSSISVAGEHLVKYSPPCTDGTSSPGRTGAGAVMGSKNLKAIAVRGTGEISLHDPRGLMESSYRAAKTMLEQEPLIKLWQEKGATTYLLTVYNSPANGAMLMENAKAADFPHLKDVGCLNCPAGCYHWLQIKDGKHSGLRHLGGHITYLIASMQNLGISDINAIIYFERLTQELGLDPAAFSLAFSWAVECFERGILKPSDTDGLTLRRGDEDLIWEIARRVAFREGNLGDLLADGVAEASYKIGGGSEGIAPHVKGKPYLGRDPRLQALIWSLGVLTNPRGGDWLRCHNVYELAFVPEKRDTYPRFTGKSCTDIYEMSIEGLDMPQELKKEIFGDPPKIDLEWIKDTKGKALFTAWTENLVCLFNSLVTCMYSAGTQYPMVGIGPTMYSEIINKITGWDTTHEELMEAGERVFNLQRLLNYRLKGWDYRKDKWADKRMYDAAKSGIYKGREIPWDSLLKEYYSIRGWSSEGIPTRVKIHNLKLEGIAKKVDLHD
jgi:aldehyde:ferredoxin oxidoreductase